MSHEMDDLIEEQECGYVFDHDEEITYDGPDGVQWYCRRCGAEGFMEPTTDAGTCSGDNEGASDA